MRITGWLLGVTLLLLIGWIGGPVVMTSYRVGTATDHDAARYAVAKALVDAHAPEGKGGHHGHSSTPADDAPIRACGYDPVALLGNEKGAFLRSADWGSEALRARASSDLNAVGRNIRAQYFAEKHSAPALAALTVCLDSPFASLCRRVVDPMAATADAVVKKETAENEGFLREQDQAILCTYLDGAAARRGITKIAPAPKPAS